MNTESRTPANGSELWEHANQASSRSVQGGGFPSWKRILDLVCVFLTLPIWLPLMVLIAIGIKAISPGCILFRQERIGYQGKTFTLFKFRSMKPNVETQAHERYVEGLIQADCPMVKLDAFGDPRIIPLGRLLRATGLDELPQIFNVVRGEMSLVGPRPCTSHERERFNLEQQKRFSVPPGLTGYWQVNGKNKTTFNEMIAMDTHYASCMSVRMDLRIMIKTIPAIIRQVSDVRMSETFKVSHRSSFAVLR